MPIYTVHEPPLKWREARRTPETFRFVRDGFHFWAFVLTPLWMLRHRLWLVLLIYIVFWAALAFALRYAGITGTAATLISVLLSFLIGMEAGTLRRWTLRRRKWIDAGIVSADNLEGAERRFFDAWTRDAPAPSAPLQPPPAYAPPAYAPQPYRGPSSAAPDIVGLFPEPRTPR